MAGDWIKVEKGTRKKREVWAIAARLGLTREVVFDRLVALWEWVDSETEDGETVDGGTRQLVDDIMGHEGAAKALEHVRWLSVTTKGLTFVNGSRHLGTTAKRRAQNARKNKEWRDDKCDRSNVTPSLSTSPPNGGLSRGDVRFDEFWREYPPGFRKTAKRQCREKWVKRRLDECADKVLAGLRALRKSDDWQRENGRFIPAPLVFLNGDRWSFEDNGVVGLAVEPMLTGLYGSQRETVRAMLLEAKANGTEAEFRAKFKTGYDAWRSTTTTGAPA